MKKLLSLLILFCFSSMLVIAQSTLPALDKSPMDMSYCPANYPGFHAQGKPTDLLTARVIAGGAKNGRKIFGGLVEYGKVWRLGANESTEIDFYTTVTIDGKKITPGRYTMYCIPDSANNKWTLIINTATDTWGAYNYDEKKDILRTDVPTQKQPTSTEALVMAFEKSSTGANLVMVWDDIKAALPIGF